MDNKRASSRSDNKGEKKPYKKDSRTGGSRPGFKKDARSADKPFRSKGGDDERSSRPKRSFDKPSSAGEDRPKRKFPVSGSPKDFGERRKSEGKTEDRKRDNDRPRRSFDKEGSGKREFDRPKRSADRDGSDRKPFDRAKRSFDKEGKKDFDRPKRSFNREDGDKKPFDRSKRSFDRDDKQAFDRPKRSFNREEGERNDSDRPKRSFNKEGREDSDRPKRSFSKDGDKKPFDRKKSFGKDGADKGRGGKKPFKKRDGEDEIEREQFEDKVYGELAEEPKVRTRYKGSKDIQPWEREDDTKSIDGPMMLNKYIAHSGECSRRDAAELVKQGKVRVNGELVLEPGHRVQPGDLVTLSGKKLTPQKDMVYILLNKPKDFITTTEDPQERKTVLDLVANAEVDRLFPVGRLDRKTTGLLLMTNDGELAHKLSHPSYSVKKVYQVTLNKNLTTADYQKIAKGVELEDGTATVDAIAYLEHRNEVGLEIHSGKNRIVRRIFESLGYEVEKLDRVMYAGLTKKNLPRGKWRFLNEKEIVFLKHFKG